ncbi:MAG TPA: ATP synthase F1 subunit delta [Candidatus Obscuribacterales bacterium]
MTRNVSAAATNYAEALMQLAAESSTDKTVLEDLQRVAEVIRLTPEFEVILRHPGIKPSEKKQLLISTFSNKINDLTLRLLELLSDRRRLDLVTPISVAYETLWREKQNILDGTLYYAEKPDSRILSEIKSRLKETLGKTLELKEKEDKSLIGGYVLRIGDQIIDGSLKGRLQSIEKQLLSV